MQFATTAFGLSNRGTALGQSQNRYDLHLNFERVGEVKWENLIQDEVLELVRDIWDIRLSGTSRDIRWHVTHLSNASSIGGSLEV